MLIILENVPYQYHIQFSRSSRYKFIYFKSIFSLGGHLEFSVSLIFFQDQLDIKSNIPVKFHDNLPSSFRGVVATSFYYITLCNKDGLWQPCLTSNQNNVRLGSTSCHADHFRKSSISISLVFKKQSLQTYFLKIYFYLWRPS